MIKFYIFIFFTFPYTLLGQNFAIIGDSRGGDTNAYKVSVLVNSFNPDFVVTVGDNFLQTQGTIDFQIGQFYHKYIFPYVGSYGLGDTINRFFPTLGNHDVEGTGLTDYQNYFTLPGNERYYDFIKGNVHFFILDSDPSELDGNTDTSVQASWLQNAILNSNSFYNLIFLHHPPYSSGLHGSNTFSQWPFKTWGADAVFSGHDHSYERLIIDSLPYFVNGTGGSPLYNIYNQVTGSQFHYAENFGAIKAIADSDSIIFKYYNIKDSLIDYFSINNKHSSIKYVNYYNKNNNLQLSVYPNPYLSSTNLKYFLFDDNEVTVVIYNTSGQKIKLIYLGKQNHGVHEFTITTEDMPQGEYTIALQTKNNNAQIKTTKIKMK